MKRILFEGSSYDEFMAQLCLKIGELLANKNQVNIPQTDELLTRQEAADMLKISLPTLNSWTKAKVLSPRYLGRRVYYRRNDILNSK